MVRLTGVNDEPSKEWDLEIGLDTLDELGVKFVELRAIDGQNVDELSDEAFAAAAPPAELTIWAPPSQYEEMPTMFA